MTFIEYKQYLFVESGLFSADNQLPLVVTTPCKPSDFNSRVEQGQSCREVLTHSRRGASVCVKGSGPPKARSRLLMPTHFCAGHLHEETDQEDIPVL